MTAEPAARPTPTLNRDAPGSRSTGARLKTLPGGTDSNFRAWGEDTVYVDRGKGGRVWDQDGNEFIDLRMGYGPVILGHGDDRVDDYVNERMRKGVSFSLTSEDEIRAMELLKELNPWVGKARMTVSGTEATMHAMRIARAYTGPRQDREVRGPVPRRPRLRADQRRAQRHDASSATRTTRSRSPGAAASRREIAKTIIPARYNNIDFLRRLFERQGDGHRRDHRRAGPRQRRRDPAQAGLPPGDAGADRGVRDPADLRRGQDGLPVRQGRRRRVLRHHAGPRDLRQGDGQRLPGRGLRRARRGHVASCPTRSATAAPTRATGSRPRRP